jgi:1,2-phenylacetyl-CoA epoxidase catalytic subunit
MRKQYIIRWNAGYGNLYEEVIAESVDEALEMAYEAWKEEIENDADYGVLAEATDELREKYLT